MTTKADGDRFYAKGEGLVGVLPGSAVSTPENLARKRLLDRIYRIQHEGLVTKREEQFRPNRVLCHPFG